MTGQKVVNTGSMEAETFTLKSLQTGEELNIFPIMQEFSIYESFEHYPTMDIVIEDANSLVTTFPIIGEEILKVELSIPDPSFVRKIRHEFRVAAIKNLYRGAQVRNSIYLIRCVSREQIVDVSSHIRKSYSNMPVSDMAKSLYDSFIRAEYEMFDEFPIDVSASEGARTIVVPNMRPREAMNFLCREAKSSEYKPSNYVFYKTLDGFYFRTFDEIINGRTGGTVGGTVVEEYFLTEKSLDGELFNSQRVWNSETGFGDDDVGNSKIETPTVGDLKDQLDEQTRLATIKAALGISATDTTIRSRKSLKPIAWQKITEFRIHRVFDLEESLSSGAFDNTFYVINPLNQYFEKKTYNYNKDYDSFQKIAKVTDGRLLYEGGELATLAGDSNLNMIVTNYGTGTENQDTKLEFANLMLAANGLINHLIVDITLVGDTDRRIGDTIDVRFPEFTGTDDLITKTNRLFAGKYVVVAVRHNYNKDVGYSMSIRCVKNAYETSIDKLIQVAKADNKKQKDDEVTVKVQ